MQKQEISQEKLLGSMIFSGSFLESVEEVVRFYCETRIKTNHFFQLLEQGGVTRDHMGQLMANITYAIQYTPLQLKRAEHYAGLLNLPKLKEFFKEKIIEETGHDKWSKNDLKKFVDQGFDKNSVKLMPSLIELMDYLAETMKAHPIYYLAYLFANEYMAANVFPIVIQGLTKNCGVDRGAISVITYHQELDQEHTEHDRKTLGDLLAEDLGMDRLRFNSEFMLAIVKSCEYLNGIYNDIALSVPQIH